MRNPIHSSVLLLALSAALHCHTAGAAATSDEIFVPTEELRHVAAPGADPNARLADGSTALHWAVYQRNTAEVERLVRAGADPRATTQYGVTPMAIAAEQGNADIIRVLLKAGADPDSPNPEGQTALMAVARTGNIDAAKLLIKAGANVNAREQWGGQTALMWAAAQRQPEMIRLLARSGAELNARSTVRYWPRKVTSEPREKNMDRGGFAPLHYAARTGCVPCAKALVESGADIDIADGLGSSPLVLSLLNLNFDTAQYLIEAGANIHLWDFFGVTPLYAAVDVNTVPQLPSADDATAVDIIKLLLQRGANVNAQLKLPIPSRTPAAGGRADKRAHNIGATPLFRASVGADVEIMKLLIEHGADVEMPMADGTPPMLGAILPSPTRVPEKNEQQVLAALRVLKEAGADPKNAVVRNPSALHLMHTHGMNEARVKGSTALMMATVNGWTEVMKQLIEWGVDPDAQDADGLTAMDYAMGRSRVGFLQQRPDPRPDLVQALRKLGATLEHPDTPPWPPLSVPKIGPRVPEVS